MTNRSIGYSANVNRVTTRSAPKGYFKATISSTARSLAYVANPGTPAIPTGATRAVVTVETDAVRFRDDGTSPTATDGMRIAAGATYEFDNIDLSVVELIRETTDATVHVSFYGEG